ncbi:MAG: fumarylacetoacetase, partial [Thermoleophilia bacterium]|nr:fumarylacetoacetase [Thermoleophilia bacterium]
MTGFGVFSVDGDGPRVGFRERDRVLDCAAAGLGDEFAEPTLNAFLARGRGAWEAAT